MAMKKFIFLSLLILISCQSTPSGLGMAAVSPSSNTQSAESVSTSIHAFQFNQQCPHLCWMGISPGVTTSQEARTILSASGEIDPKWLRVSDAGILAVWNTSLNSSQPFKCNIGIAFENDTVKTISFSALPLRLKDFTNLIGEPDKISITSTETVGGKYIHYDVYFSAKKAMIEIYPGALTGPDPNDYISELLLNTEFRLKAWQEKAQPWLGYGHIKDYLPGAEIP